MFIVETALVGEDNWQDAWSQTFETEAEAEAEIADLIASTNEAVDRGDMTERYTRDDFRIVELDLEVPTEAPERTDKTAELNPEYVLRRIASQTLWGEYIRDAELREEARGNKQFDNDEGYQPSSEDECDALRDCVELAREMVKAMDARRAEELRQAEARNG